MVFLRKLYSFLKVLLGSFAFKKRNEIFKSIPLKKIQYGFDGFVHGPGVLEEVVGVRHGHKLHELLVGNALGAVHGHDLVLGAVEDQHVVHIGRKILVQQVHGP